MQVELQTPAPPPAPSPGLRLGGPGGGLGSWGVVEREGWRRTDASVPRLNRADKGRQLRAAGGDRVCLCPPGHLLHIACCQLATVADSMREQCNPVSDPLSQPSEVLSDPGGTLVCQAAWPQRRSHRDETPCTKSPAGTRLMGGGRRSRSEEGRRLGHREKETCEKLPHAGAGGAEWGVLLGI